MSLGDYQAIFTFNVGRLILFAYEKGYTLSFGDTWSKPEYGAHKMNSLHYDRLAVDFNLKKDGVYQTKSEAYEVLGRYWESLHPLNHYGGNWDGDDKHFEPGEHDGNHFSLSPPGDRRR